MDGEQNLLKILGNYPLEASAKLLFARHAKNVVAFFLRVFGGGSLMATRQKTQKDIEKLVVGGATPEVVNAPVFHVASTRIAVAPTNFNIVFSRLHPVSFTAGNEKIQAATAVDVVVLDMSPQTAKDLALVLQGVVDKYEKEWGTLETEFTRKRAAEVSAAETQAKRAAAPRSKRIARH